MITCTAKYSHWFTRYGQAAIGALLGAIQGGCVGDLAAPPDTRAGVVDGGALEPAPPASGSPGAVEAGTTAEGEGGAVLPCAGCKRVFLTRATFKGGEMGGLRGADAACNTAAEHLGGTYMAWLSDGAGSPVIRFPTESPTPYVRTDGRTIAFGFVELTTKPILAPIDRDETGARVTGANVAVWSNVLADGSTARSGSYPAAHCSGWSLVETTGSIGYADQIAGGAWTNANVTPGCVTSAHLYCFEQ
jgi:hypothetical protein